MFYPNFCSHPREREWLYAPMDQATLIELMKQRIGRGEGKVTQAELARAIGLTAQSAVSNILQGKRNIRVNERAKIEAFLGIEKEPTVQWVPVIGLASAGVWQEAILMPVKEIPVPFRTAGKRSFGVEIKGDSMDKLLPEGGWAIVDPDQTALYAGRVYLIQNGEHEATVKRYCGDPARFEPVSNNPDHKPFTLANQAYTIVGRIVSYGHDGGL